MMFDNTQLLGCTPLTLAVLSILLGWLNAYPRSLLFGLPERFPAAQSA